MQVFVAAANGYIESFASSFAIVIVSRRARFAQPHFGVVC